MSYSAIVCRLTNLRAHSNADRIQLATASGHQVIIGLDALEDDLGVYFPTDGKLNYEYASKNDLIRIKHPDGTISGGFFELPNLRVRAQKFRGEQSDGFWIPIDSLVKAGVKDTTVCKLNVGDQFTELDGKEICTKYFTEATRKAMQQQPKKRSDTVIKSFPKHVDTMQFRFLQQIPKNAIIYFTEKLHGTSARSSLAFVEQKSKLKHQLLRRLFKKPRTIISVQNKFVNGTRNVVLSDSYTGYYDSEDFRIRAASQFEENLHKGEILYYEIVGYTNTQPIMPIADTSKLQDKAIQKQYGKQMSWAYGTEPGQHRIFVYRIAWCNEDGILTELSWPQVKARCKELGVSWVPELYEPVLWGLESDQQDLGTLVEQLAKGASTVDSRHLREGVVLRIESVEGTQFVKEKSFEFKVLEGICKDNITYVDTEEIS